MYLKLGLLSSLNRSSEEPLFLMKKIQTQNWITCHGGGDYGGNKGDGEEGVESVGWGKGADDHDVVVPHGVVFWLGHESTVST